MGYFVTFFNTKAKRIEIDNLLIANHTIDDHAEVKIYIHLNEDKNPADRNYFYQKAYLGSRILTAY